MRRSTPAERASEAAESVAPPRIPVTDQRLIRITAVAALVGALLSALLLLSVNPNVDQIAGLAASLAFGCTLALATAPALLVESYRRHPGQWRGRRRRALRRSFIVGALVGGYSAFRVVGLGSPSGFLMATLIAATIEAALTRADDDSV
jgi:uncharacterized membrane protein YfcA